MYNAAAGPSESRTSGPCPCSRRRKDRQRESRTRAKCASSTVHERGQHDGSVGHDRSRAYIYLYPLVTMDLTRRAAHQHRIRPGAGSWSDERIRPHPDLPRRALSRRFGRISIPCIHCLARREPEPVVISAPDTQGRCYLLAMLDMWTDVFAVPGKRTTGTCPSHWAIVGPGSTRQLAGDLERITSPTPTSG